MNIKTWIDSYRKSLNYQIEMVHFNKLNDWKYNEKEGLILREDGAFFSIQAIKSAPKIDKYDELPLIKQPEIGILGFILSWDKNGEKVLLQAKSEPGNVELTQIGPSVQATESNYKSKHNGKKQKYIEFFLNPAYPKTISIKQSEQGTRFLNKYNLNAVVEVEESDIKIDEEKYRWFYLNEIIEALNEDFLFNTDFKSVITHLLEGFIKQKSEHIKNGNHLFLNSYFNNIGNEVSSLIKSLTGNREKNSFIVYGAKLTDLKNWQFTSDGILPKNKLDHGFKFFNIKLDDREVPEWGQPLITKESHELIDLLCYEENDEIRFVFRERAEMGFENYVQLAPTHQYDFFPGNYDFILKGECLTKFSQSEEGGRFYQNISEYSIIKVNNSEVKNLTGQFRILNLYQICQLLKIEGIFTNEARSLIAGIFTLLN